MIRATVTGTVWATRRLNEIPNGAFLEVRALDSEHTFVAFDVLGSGVGEEVLVVQGSVASAWFGETHPPVDALIIGSVDPVVDPAEQGAREPALEPAVEPAVEPASDRTVDPTVDPPQ